MKIGIVFVGDIAFCPYVAKYKEMCEAKCVEYDIIFWNRSNDQTKYPDNYISYNLQSDLKQSKIKKAKDFLQYQIWLKRVIKKGKYDKLILLSTLSGVIIANILKEYKGKYIFDIRDYSYEHIKWFYAVEKKIIENSFFTCISSPGFKSFLPEHNYLISHNIQSEFLKYKKGFSQKKYGETLNIVWNGMVRYFSYQSKILKRLKDDPRFMIYYFGWGPELDRFKQYTLENAITNVVFAGKYDNSEKTKILRDADILNNAYWRSMPDRIIHAISNRYYDGLVFGIPQIVEAGSYKSKICEKNRIGIPFADSDEFADNLYEWYFQLNPVDFDKSCEELLKNIDIEMSMYEKRISDFLDI